MKKLFGNSCAKGCLVYFVALVIIVTLTAMGLGGLKGKFSQDVQNSQPQASIFSTNDQSTSSASVPQALASANSSTAGGASKPTSAPAQPAQSAPQAPAQPAVQPTAQQSKPPIQIQVQTPGGAISADASLPFYIVQPNDTLWSIAQGFNVQVDALGVLNTLSGDLIKPGQLIYLPQLGKTQQPQAQTQQQPQQQAPPASAPAQSAPQAPSGQSSDTNNNNTNIPTLPQTGINNKP